MKTQIKCRGTLCRWGGRKRRRRNDARATRQQSLRCRCLKRMTSLDWRGVYCWDKQLTLTSTLHDQHERTCTCVCVYTHTITIIEHVINTHHSQSSGRWPSRFIHWCAGRNFVLISSIFLLFFLHWVKHILSLLKSRNEHVWAHCDICCSADTLML